MARLRSRGGDGPGIDVDPFVVVGSLVLLATAAAWGVASNPTFDRLVQASLPTLVGVGLVAYGFRRSPTDDPAASWLALAWSGVGLLSFVLIGGWFFIVGVTYETAYWLALVTSLSTGASLGLLTGGYAARLRESNRRLESRTERLEEFASIVSHDLRNPLTVARGRLDLARTELTDGDGSAADVDAHLETVDDAHDRMDRLIDRLLRLAREGSTVEDPDRLDIGAVARERWETVATGDARLVVETDREVLGDEELVGQLFENLFRNAIEHAAPDPHGPEGVTDGGATERQDGDDPDPSVTVTVGETTEGFYVADDGPGIPPEERDRVFESGESGAGGTGLGLAIVESVVEAHDWSVQLTEAAGGGARFEFAVSDPAESADD